MLLTILLTYDQSLLLTQITGFASMLVFEWVMGWTPRGKPCSSWAPGRRDWWSVLQPWPCTARWHVKIGPSFVVVAERLNVWIQLVQNISVNGRKYSRGPHLMNTSPVSASHMLEAALPTSLVVARPEQTLILSRRVVHPGFHTSIERS